MKIDFSKMDKFEITTTLIDNMHLITNHQLQCIIIVEMSRIYSSDATPLHMYMLIAFCMKHLKSEDLQKKVLDMPACRFGEIGTDDELGEKQKALKYLRDSNMKSYYRRERAKVS